VVIALKLENIKFFLNVINIFFILVAGWYMTQRVYPPLNNLQNIFGLKYNKKLRKIVLSLSMIDLSHDPKVQEMKEAVCDAFLSLCDSFSDNENAVADAVNRAKKGIIFLIIALIIQGILLFFY
jgi:hypothetical protein